PPETGCFGHFLKNKIHVRPAKNILIGYGVVRFFIEYFRQPDAHLGFVFLSFSLGQIFSGFMILVGFSVYLYISLTREG
ncbi:MAG TPA: hypothetical protein ENI07_16635, partial [Desulfobacterales bacterium]|nr:hypothetical protein [Desulfobacterales bacterium]